MQNKHIIEFSIRYVVVYMEKLKGILEDVTVWIFYIFLGFGIIVLMPLLIVVWLYGGATYTPGNPILDFFFSFPYLLALAITWGPVVILFPVYYFLHVKALPSRILNTLKFYGRMKIGDLATRFSTTEDDTELAILKLEKKGDGCEIRYDEEKREVIYIPFKKFIGIIDIVYDTEKYMLYFTSSRVIVARITRDKLDKLKQISGGEILRADEKNFSIPYSDIVKVEVTEWPRGGSSSNIVTEEKTYTFGLRDPSILGHHHYTGKKLFEDYEAILRSILPDKLSIQ